MKLSEKFSNIYRQVPYLARALRLVWKIAPGSTLAWIFLLVVQGLLPVAIVYLTRSIVNNIAEVIGAENAESWQNYQLVVEPIALMVLVLLLMAVLRSVLNIIRAQQSQLVQDKISTLIQEKSVTLDFSYYDLPEYYDKLHRARSNAAYRPVELIEALSSLLQNSITLLAMASVLIPYGIWAPMILVVSTLPVLFVVLKHRLNRFNYNYRNTERERRAWYYDWLLTSRESAAEIRMFDLGEYFRDAFSTLRTGLRKESQQLHRSQAFSEIGASIFALVITGGAMGWMVWKAIIGTVTVGDLALFYQAFNQGQRLMRSLLESVGQMYSNSLFLGDLFDFFDLEPLLCDPANPEQLPDLLQEGISFQNVSFSYSLGNRSVINNFNLKIPAQKITAIVGANGAGKSTLIKLLCRFYAPVSGAILYDNININQCAIQDIRKKITILFQEPMRFNTSVAKNIGFSDLKKYEKKELIANAAHDSGADTIIAKLPDEYDTLLGRWFANSTDLSGGEWQRIALARAFLRQSPVIILDEPTSAMDSWSEMDWVKKFRKLAKGRTGIIIAHRFTTAMQADIIHVMENGKIVESGSHTDLLSLNGKYAASWKEQIRGEQSTTHGQCSS